MNLQLTAESSKGDVFEKVKNFLQQNNFKIIDSDKNRPWGGFYVIDETQSQKFVDFFFNGVHDSKNKDILKISPKILIVGPKKRLSWQYHHRRAELWKVIGGEVGVIQSENNDETEVKTKIINDLIKLKQGERHRLIGLENWGIVAEIWQHVDHLQPSDENDIVRLQDDFGR
jgi:mannose-6-phosphate isomerase